MYIRQEKNLFYNLCIDLDDEEQVSIYIFIRVKQKDDKMNLGASHMAGLYMLSPNDVPMYKQNKAKFMEDFDAYCADTVEILSHKEIVSIFR